MAPRSCDTTKQDPAQHGRTPPAGALALALAWKGALEQASPVSSWRGSLFKKEQPGMRHAQCAR